jgi:hypothetical protein
LSKIFLFIILLSITLIILKKIIIKFLNSTKKIF